MSGSQSGRRPPANFTGNWLMDVKASDSLDPLLTYHGVAVTPVAALSVQNVIEVGSVTSPNALHTTTSSSSSASHSELRVVTSSDGSHTAQIRSDTAALGLGGVAESLAKGQSVMGQSFLGSLSASPSSLSSDSPSSATFSASPAVITPGTALASVAELPQESDSANDAATTADTITTTTITTTSSSTTIITTSTESDPSSATSSASIPSPLALLSPTTALPALIVQHSTRRLTTYLHNLIPRYNESGTLVRYDPVQTNSKLSVHEEYKIDGQYHVINTARGKVEARCYAAPHGQSVVVDTRCASKYDLERTERFLEDGGRTMVIEIRILSCAPELQNNHASTKGVSKRFEEDGSSSSSSANASKSSSPVKSNSAAVAPNQVVVKEILFLRRVFRRIMDADPAAAAKAAAAAAVSTPPTPSSTVLLPAFGSGTPSTSRIDEEDASSSSSSFKGAKLDFDSEEVTSHHSPVKQRPVETAYQSTHLLPSFTSHMLSKEQQAAVAPGAITAGFTIVEQQQTNVWGRIREALLYPQVSIMRRYQLSELLVNDDATARNPHSTASLQTAVAAETKTLIAARRTMLVVDLVLLLAVLLFLVVRFGFFSSDQLQDVISEGIESVQQSAQAAVAGTVKTEL